MNISGKPSFYKIDSAAPPHGSVEEAIEIINQNQDRLNTNIFPRYSTSTFKKIMIWIVEQHNVNWIDGIVNDYWCAREPMATTLYDALSEVVTKIHDEQPVNVERFKCLATLVKPLRAKPAFAEHANMLSKAVYALSEAVYATLLNQKPAPLREQLVPMLRLLGNDPSGLDNQIDRVPYLLDFFAALEKNDLDQALAIIKGIRDIDAQHRFLQPAADALCASAETRIAGNSIYSPVPLPNNNPLVEAAIPAVTPGVVTQFLEFASFPLSLVGIRSVRSDRGLAAVESGIERHINVLVDFLKSDNAKKLPSAWWPVLHLVLSKVVHRVNLKILKDLCSKLRENGNEALAEELKTMICRGIVF